MASFPTSRSRNVSPAIPARASKLPTYEIQIEGAGLEGLERSAYSNETYPVRFLAGGETYEKATIRYRGAWARGWPKKPLKIFFDKEHRFDGRRCLNLNSGWRDPAFIRETLAYHIFAQCGAICSTSRVVCVNFNDVFRGIYVEVEQPDKPLLQRSGLKGGVIYKANSQRNWADERDLGAASEFSRHYEQETEKSAGFAPLQQFCHELAVTTNVQEFFEKQVDVERYINFLAATVLVQNWDGFNKNHFLVHDLKGSGKWLPLPWDLDRTLGDHWNQSFDESSLPILLGVQRNPGITGWNRLQNRFLQNPALTTRFFARLEELLRTEFTIEKLFPVLDRLQAETQDDIAAEYRQWPRHGSDFSGGIAQVKAFIRDRRKFLLSQIAKQR